MPHYDSAKQYYNYNLSLPRSIGDCKPDEYRELLKQAIIELKGNPNKLDIMNDHVLMYYYYTKFISLESAAKDIMNFDINDYRETIRKEIEKQGEDVAELDKVDNKTLLFYRTSYKTNKQVAIACVKHYR